MRKVADQLHYYSLKAEGLHRLVLECYDLSLQAGKPECAGLRIEWLVQTVDLWIIIVRSGEMKESAVSRGALWTRERTEKTGLRSQVL